MLVKNLTSDTQPRLCDQHVLHFGIIWGVKKVLMAGLYPQRIQFNWSGVWLAFLKLNHCIELPGVLLKMGIVGPYTESL